MTWVRNGTPDTLIASGSNLQITNLTAYKSNMVLSHHVGKITNQGLATSIFGDSASNDYAQRKSINGGADGTDLSQSSWYDQSVRTDVDDSFAIHFIVNKSGEEKLAIEFAINNNGDGATNPPERLEFVGKYDTSTNSGQFTQIDMDGSAGSMGNGTNITVLGSN